MFFIAHYVILLCRCTLTGVLVVSILQAVTTAQKPHHNTMRILRAIGLGIALVVLKLVIPAVFAAGEQTLITFFETADSILKQAQQAAQTFPISPPRP